MVYAGGEAVATARSFDPDLVCLDLGMPKMDGFEAARRIRAHNDSIVLVAISGWGTDEDRRRTAEAGFDHHLLKPVKPDDLRDVIGRYLPDHQPCKSDCAPSI